MNGRRSLKNRVTLGLVASAFVAIFFLQVPFPVIVMSAGLSNHHRPVAWGPIRFDAPVLRSVHAVALLLSIAAVVAIFRFKVGMVPTLAATSVTGIVLYLAGALS